MSRSRPMWKSIGHDSGCREIQETYLGFGMWLDPPPSILIQSVPRAVTTYSYLTVYGSEPRHFSHCVRSFAAGMMLFWSVKPFLIFRLCWVTRSTLNIWSGPLGPVSGSKCSWRMARVMAREAVSSFGSGFGSGNTGRMCCKVAWLMVSGGGAGVKSLG